MKKSVDLENSEDFIEYYDEVHGATKMPDVISELLNHEEISVEPDKADYPTLFDLKYNGIPIIGATVMREIITVTYLDDIILELENNNDNGNNDDNGGNSDGTENEI